MNITTSKQAEKLAEIGAQFKRIRQDKDLSIPHLTATTLISERYLRAIEDGEIESLPEPVYVRGFIRKYGTALGVGDLSDDFPLNPVLPEQKWAGSAAAELRPLHLYALYVGVIAGAVSLLATFLNPPEANKINDNQTIFGNSAQISPAKTNKSTTAIDVLLPKIGGLEVLRQVGIDQTGKAIPNISKTTAPAQPPVGETVTATLLNQTQAQTAFTEASFGFNNALTIWASSTNLQNNSSAIVDNPKFDFVGSKPVNVGIVAKGESWVRIIVDGQTEFEGMLNEGKKLSWSGDRQISIRAGNASSIALSYNNQSIKLLGKEGEVAERNFGLNQANNVEVNDDSVRGFVEFMSTSNSQ
ncbi:helix-turn-helix domain-containing protein [Pseudanabaena sp. FACHB-1998]|uniref:helix-turn-helix domain-containing protein n=1 Tax=Pseudanabaena sp. FACHB-1998 TaxID=2692858 RepID=UPI001680629C